VVIKRQRQTTHGPLVDFIRAPQMKSQSLPLVGDWFNVIGACANLCYGSHNLCVPVTCWG